MPVVKVLCKLFSRLAVSMKLWSAIISLFLILTLKAAITTAADTIHKYVFICFSEKIRLDVSRERIHMKNQALFSLKYKSKILKCHLLQF